MTPDVLTYVFIAFMAGLMLGLVLTIGVELRNTRQWKQHNAGLAELNKRFGSLQGGVR